MQYKLILWPQSQELMEYPWFNEECWLAQAIGDQEHIDSAYFVPIKRLKEIGDKTVITKTDIVNILIHWEQTLNPQNFIETQDIDPEEFQGAPLSFAEQLNLRDEFRDAMRNKRDKQ